MEELKGSRELDWEELSDIQKIERMHGIVKTQKRRVENLKLEVEKLTEHSHGPVGEILLPFSSRRGPSESEHAIRSDKYF
ncbi:MAG: hypothetical protein Q8P56_01550 [Candidatus Uhrbacteria bacterium]|nr:hypothetical protein [Candidatus Uhrbacteria bacterium]